MAQKQEYVMWGDVNNVPYITVKNGKFECILKKIFIDRLLYLSNTPKNITSAVFPELTAINSDSGLAYLFNGCSQLTSVSFPKLVTLGGFYNMLSFCSNTALTSVSFPELTTLLSSCIFQTAFTDCPKLTSISFPKLTTVTYPKTAFYQMGSSTLTVHLPKALSSLGITNDNESNSSSYCKFAYDL